MLSRYLPSDGAIRSFALYGVPEMLAAVAMPLMGKNTERSASAPDSRDTIQVLKAGQICRAGTPCWFIAVCGRTIPVDFLRRLSLERSYFVLRVLPVSAVSVLVWNFSGYSHDSSMPLSMACSPAEQRYMCFHLFIPRIGPLKKNCS